MADEADALKLYWEHFFKAETGAYEKSTWLDLFLAEFLIRLNDGANPKELIKFCPVSGVVSLVGCELLCGIHRVTSSINTHYCAPLPCLDAGCSGREPAADTATASDDAETKSDDSHAQATSLFSRANAQSSAEILRKYLLGGIAWRCLVLLRALGVEGLSCCRQLSSVLIWLFGEVSGAEGVASPAPPETQPRTPIHQLFSPRIWSKQKLLGSAGSKPNSVGSSEKSSVTGRSRHISQHKLDLAEAKAKRKLMTHSSQSSETGDSADDLQILNRSLTVKVCAPSDDFEYFDSPARSNEYPNDTLYADPFYVPRKLKPKADNYMTDKHREIINSEITTFEFTLLITDLLQELCKTESSLSGSEGSQISVQCINFSLRNLCSLQFGSLPPLSAQYDRYEISRTKVALTELLIVSLDKVLIHSDLCAKLINNGILPMLLRILEDVICKSNSKFRSKEEKAKETVLQDKTESENLLNFIFGIAYSITAFFHCLLMQCRTVDKLREFTEQFKLYGECLKGGLLRECIELMIRVPGVDEESVVILIKKLIESVGKLICGMKRVRSEVVHSAACPRTRHKVCRQRVAAGMHHHHDILGEAGTGLPLSSACSISILYGTLTSLVTDEEVSAQSVLRNKLLRVMLGCGACCCFSPGLLMESIVRLMLTHNSVAMLCLQLLEHTVYGELGASVLAPRPSEQLPCAVCEAPVTPTRACPHLGPADRATLCSFLIHYNSLLQLDNHNNVLHATVSHLLRVTPKCRVEMKYELLFSVIYPTFIVAKHRYIIRMEESAYFLTVSCLNIFASLLNTVSFAEQFIQKGGLSYVLELVSLSEFSNQCCSILEIAIIVEIFKLMQENSDMTYFREISSLASVQMLFKSLSEMTDKFYKIYKLKLPLEKFEELCDVTRERESLAFMPRSNTENLRKMSLPKPIMTTFATAENVVEDSIDDYLEVLKNIWTFWKTCASLCLYSPVFREHVASEPALADSYALLKLTLHCLCRCECAAAEARFLIKIMEAVLTVQFAVSDVTSGRSKETSCGLVRAALTAPVASLDGGGGLRALCEALIRVCLARPSSQHAMPRLHHAKVPPLGCPSGSSSAECSSSEDSTAGPYASEHSDPGVARPDEGYEADVEIGKLELLSSYKSKKLSGSLLNMSGLTGWPSLPADALCAEYTRSGELAHPELCVIVVDILTQLIHKLVEVPETGDKQESVQRAGASLARACCARLAGALGGARAAPPRLLRRLLAPPAAALLARTDHHLQDLQRSILELIEVVASQSVEPSELSAFLRLFAGDAPPIAPLLTTLRRLLEQAAPNTPDCILTFPIDTDNKDDIASLSEELNYVVVSSGASSNSALAEANARKLQDAHTRAGIKSPWSLGAVRCGMEGAGWAPWLQGFALLLWLRTAPKPAKHRASPPHDDWETADEWQDEPYDTERTPKKSPLRKESGSEELAHLVSIGHESLVFEVWLHTGTGELTFRLSRPDAGSSKVMSEARVESGIAAHAWTCLALNVREAMHKRRIHIQVTLFVNGCECETIALPLQGILVRKVMPTSLVVGHAASGVAGDAVGVYHVSHVTVYRSPVMAAPAALHLAAHGPDHACQVRCETPNFPLVLTPNVLDTNIDWDQVFEISTATLREVHDSVLLTFSAHAPTIVNLYHQTVAMPTGGTPMSPTLFSVSVFAGRVAAPGALLSGAGGASIPEALPASWRASPLASRHRGLPPAIYMMGGPDLLLYLFARVVELEGSAAEQATALGILLRACRVDNRLHAQLYADSSLDMLHTVFAAPKCRLSHHMIKVILDEACSAPILTWSGGGPVVASRSDAVLLQPRLLVMLTRAWRHLDTDQEVTWEVESSSGARQAMSGSLWALAMFCMRVLVRGADDEHPRRAFNLYQMTRLGMLRHLLLACKERFLNSECAPLTPTASDTLVALVRALMADPPLLDRLALLADFLLLMHQASDTFVTHSRASFYFLVSSEAPETSSLQSSSRRRSTRRSRRKTSDSLPAARSSSSLTSEDSNTRQEDSDPTDRVSLDSTKQMKGLINAKIKEGRKHISSTSDNSDVPLEQLGATGLTDGGGDGAPTGDDQGVSLGDEQGAIAGDGEGAPPGDGEGAIQGDGEGAPPGDAQVEVDKEESLIDYIVVDVDEVNHATVEMYASGIFQQSRVRAGAEPGWRACEGLLLLLRDTLAALPPHEVAQAVCGAVQMESVVVLANHRSAAVRAALLRVVAALQRRAPPDAAAKLRHHHYYTHLANQIALYPGSWELAAACAALVTKCDVPLEDQLDDDIWADVGEEAAHRSPPLLAMLPCCLHDVPLAHNLTLLIRRLIAKASLKMLSEVSVAEVAVRSIRSVGLMEEFEGRALLLEDFSELLNRIALKALASPHSMQTIAELHHMLSFVEVSAQEGEGAVQAARDAQLGLFGAQLDYLEERLHSSYSAHTKYANYFTTVLSSAVSLGADAAGRGERAELAARHLATVSRAVSFLLSRSPSLPANAEGPLLDRLLATLLPAVSGATARPKWWVSSGADWLSPLQEVFWWAASPAPGARELQPRLLRALYLAPPHALHLLAPNDPPAMRKLAIYLLTILKHIHALAEAGTPPVELAITDWARSWALSTQAGLPDRLPSDALGYEAARLLRHDEERWAKAAARHQAAIAKVVFSKEPLASKLTEGAMGITRQVVDVQNGERKAFLEHLRRAHSDAAACTQRWQRLVDSYTHEQAVWHDPRSYPQSWQLDATEGPGRVRVRLRRAHLDIPPRFLKPQYRYKAETMNRPAPLRSVVGAGCGLRGGLVARLQLNETVSYMARVVYVTVASETPGELLLSDRCIHFVPEDSVTDEHAQRERLDGACAQSWPLEAVVQVASRRWCLRETAAELFLSSGHAHLLAFSDTAERSAFLKALNSCHLPNKTEPDTLAEAMAQWRSGSITNWEYLMRLNGLGGRSYNDLMQYPVLPFVIADYSSRILDLNDPASFRDLTKPMAIQNKNREQHYINTYNDLKAARREGCSPLLSRQPHHYASLYSNSGGVLHYLVRQPPFTELFLNYQDNNFDMPDRTFHSLATTWRLITNDSPTDVKEMIPELFYLPEVFHNTEGLDLGVRQCGAAVDDVELPPWAADARLFTLVHRHALEAAHVTERLPHWIDLVFGYKQTGQAAVDAINVFPACTYYGFDPSALEDEVDRTAAAAMVRTYGQAPRQLLRTPHPHAAADLAPAQIAQKPVWGGVEGARWGRYCGSPALGVAGVASRRVVPGGAVLHALPHARSVAVAAHATALVALPGESSASSQGSGGQAALALLSWGHSDNVVRLKRRRDVRPDLLLHVPALDRITKVSSCCVSAGCPSPVVMGYESGRVVALRFRHDAHGVALGAMPPRVRTRLLPAHSAPIADLHVCAGAGLLATASTDGKIVLWDLNKLSYIRTLPNRDMLAVTHVTISPTLCDVATVHDPARRHAEDAPANDTADDSDSYEKDSTYKYKSLMRVHTVNARFVGSVKVSETVTGVCYSAAAEGVSVNCVAAGLANGAVRLYSSWDLRLVAHIPPACRGPLTSLTYSSDSMVLFGCYADGTAVAWESGLGGRPASVRILPAHALF